jgi:hypothetical protein
LFRCGATPTYGCPPQFLYEVFGHPDPNPEGAKERSASLSPQLRRLRLAAKSAHKLSERLSLSPKLGNSADPECDACRRVGAAATALSFVLRPMGAWAMARRVR